MPTDTFNIATGLDDGRVVLSGAAWPPVTAGTAATEANIHCEKTQSAGPSFLNNVVLVRWDTSSIPDDATITAATFRGYVTAKISDGARSMSIEYYASSNWPIDNADGTVTPGTDAHAGTLISAITLNADNDFALLNPATSISKTDYTGLRIHISGGAPGASEDNYVEFAALEHATLVECRLLVTYDLAPAGVPIAWIGA